MTMPRSRRSSCRISSSMNKGLLSVDEALAQLLAGAKPVETIEELPTLEATNRVLARSQRSTMDVPPMDNSAMDGYAVRTADLDRKSTRLNSSHTVISYAVFCLKKKTKR